MMPNDARKTLKAPVETVPPAASAPVRPNPLPFYALDTRACPLGPRQRSKVDTHVGWYRDDTMVAHLDPPVGQGVHWTSRERVRLRKQTASAVKEPFTSQLSGHSTEAKRTEVRSTVPCPEVHCAHSSTCTRSAVYHKRVDVLSLRCQFRTSSLRSYNTHRWTTWSLFWPLAATVRGLASRHV